MQQNPLIKEYLDLVFRRKWWIIVPTVCGVLFSIALFFRMPQKFMAETRVQLRPQAISKRLLEEVVDINAVEEVNKLKPEITSDEYMRRLDDKLHLIGKPNEPKDLQELAKKVARSIDLDIDARKNYFDLKVIWNDPRLAAQVANELASIYIEVNQKIRQQITDETLSALRARREEIEKQLEAAQERVIDFRSRHRYELESFRTTNENNLELINRELANIQKQIRDFESEKSLAQIQLEALDEDGAAAADPRRAELERLRGELADLRAQGKGEQHPLVRAARSRIAQLERQIERDRGDAGDGEEALQRKTLLQRIARIDEEIAALRAKHDRLLERAREINARLDATGENQLQLEALEREVERLEEEYADAKDKESRAQQGKQLESLEGLNERFIVLKHATPPREPFWPDLKLFLFMGLAIGGGLGVALVLLLEVFDQSYKSEEQLAASIDLPILAVVPDLNRAIERSQKKRGGARNTRATA